MNDRKPSVEEAERNQQALFREQQPVLKDLADAGYDISSLWDQSRETKIPDRAIDVLVRHLQNKYSFQIRWAIANMISGQYAKRYWPLFVSLFNEDPDVSGFKAKAAIGGLIGKYSDDSSLQAVISLVREEKHGESRVALMDSLARKKSPEAAKALEELTEDPSVGGIAKQILKRIAKRKKDAIK